MAASSAVIRRFFPWILSLVALLSLSSTAAEALPSSESFEVSGRFALSLRQDFEQSQQASGRFIWQSAQGAHVLLLMSPMGNALVSLSWGPEGAEVQFPDGRRQRAVDGGQLLRDTTGLILPVAHLGAWLHGQLARGEAYGTRVLDAHGRTLELREAGWQLRYDYLDSAPLPSRLMIEQADQVSLRLRLEEWSDAPADFRKE